MAALQPPEVWQPWQHGGADVSPGKALANWVVKTASVYVHLANDAGETVMFSQTQPADSSSDTAAAGPPAPAEEDAAATEHRAIEPKGRQWVKSPLQVPALSTSFAAVCSVLAYAHVTGARISTQPGYCTGP